MSDGADDLMRWFRFSEGLPGHLLRTAEAFEVLAVYLISELDPGAERTVALRKLLEAKEAAMRQAHLDRGDVG